MAIDNNSIALFMLGVFSHSKAVGLEYERTIMTLGWDPGHGKRWVEVWNTGFIFCQMWEFYSYTFTVGSYKSKQVKSHENKHYLHWFLHEREREWKRWRQRERERSWEMFKYIYIYIYFELIYIYSGA